MGNLQSVKRFLMPALKGTPIILACLAVSIIIASKSLIYSVPMYEATARLKLDDVNHGLADHNLFKNFDVFSFANKIMTEVEVFKSTTIVLETALNLKMDVTYHREGKIKTIELYKNSPFKVSLISKNEVALDKKYYIKIHDHLHYTVSLNDKNYYRNFGDTLRTEQFEAVVSLNQEAFKIEPNIKLTDTYYFLLNSEESILSKVIKNLDVKELDKEMSIVRIIYKDEIPERAMLFANQLGKTYINDCIRIKTNAANNTLKFLDSQLEIISDRLNHSELKMEKYRLTKRITNTRMEVETNLKKVAELKIQLANIEMNEASLDTLDRYVNEHSPEQFITLAPNYESQGGLLYTELSKRLKALQADKKDLLAKYTQDNTKIKIIDEKIRDVINYIRENIHNTRKSFRIQKNEIKRTIKEAELDFDEVPTKEKEMVILERDFQLNQAIYKFLTEKRTEAEIAKSATISFHRIIQYSFLPKAPVSPKKNFTILVSAFLGTFLGLGLVYLKDAISAKVKFRDEVEKNSSIPVIGIVKKQKNSAEYSTDIATLANKLLISGDYKKMVITSTIPHEGKSYISFNLAKNFALLGYNVILVDLNLHKPKIHQLADVSLEKGVSDVFVNDLPLHESIKSYSKNLSIISAGSYLEEPLIVFSDKRFEKFIQQIEQLADIVIMDTPAAGVKIDAINALLLADLSLFVVRADFTRMDYLNYPDLIKEEYKIPNMQIILNDVHITTNYSGFYTGSHYHYLKETKGPINILKHYLKYYFK